MRDGRRQLVVIGAGFAGLACARAAAQRGVEVAVLEAQPAPGHRVSTTGILVKEAADAWDVPRSLTRKIHGVRLYSPSLDWVDLERSGYYFLATETADLLAWWAREAARHGVEVRWDERFSGSQDLPDGTLWLLGQGYGCEFLVGADGARSAVARDRGLDANRELLHGLELECLGLGGVAEDRIHVFLDSELAPGYIAWIVPGTSCYQVGLACRHPQRPDPERLVAALSRRFDTRDMTVLGHRSGWIPVGGPLRRIGDARSLLVGDAAGWVSPLTAGGIHTAIEWGRLAGIAVADHLLDGGPLPHLALRRSLPSFHCKRWLRWAIDLELPNPLYDRLLASPLMRQVARLVFFHHRGVMSRDAWREWLGSSRARLERAGAKI
ncbi:MAG TPA: FAD-dependent oxidoreductase [Thermoanaerobaculales bacterium]|nr:FAD-dependent oxidoreductase [Thermoanaerobaculales bacterium]HQL29969.1 FAD-dependent oxidoreductase [Thermoanaerobaculales bacterium]